MSISIAGIQIIVSRIRAQHPRFIGSFIQHIVIYIAVVFHLYQFKVKNRLFGRRSVYFSSFFYFRCSRISFYPHPHPNPHLCTSLLKVLRCDGMEDCHMSYISCMKNRVVRWQQSRK